MHCIEHALKLAISNAAEGDTDFRVTLEAIGAPEKWVQLSWDTINAAYPAEKPPLETLASLSFNLPEYVTVSDWKANEYATFEHGAEPLLELVRFVEQYFLKVLDVSAIDNSLRIAEDAQ